MKTRAALAPSVLAVTCIAVSCLAIVACKTTHAETPPSEGEPVEVPPQPVSPASAPTAATEPAPTAAPAEPEGGGDSERTCKTDSDCGWGELKKDIASKADCPCLFGCPHLPLNKSTIERRQSQYKKLCTPGKAGQNDDPCPVDDCMAPKKIFCKDGVCAP